MLDMFQKISNLLWLCGPRAEGQREKDDEKGEKRERSGKYHTVPQGYVKVIEYCIYSLLSLFLLSHSA
jgi:hypothetical protein